MVRGEEENKIRSEGKDKIKKKGSKRKIAHFIP